MVPTAIVIQPTCVVSFTIHLVKMYALNHTGKEWTTTTFVMDSDISSKVNPKSISLEATFSN